MAHMARKHKFLDLNRVDWGEVGNRVCEVLITIEGNQVSFEAAAKNRGTTIAQLTAAALTEMVKEYLESQATK
jgi:hypothetical protein